MIDLIVDCSVYWYKCIWRLKTAGYSARTKSEIKEFARQFLTEMLTLKMRFKPNEFILGIDSKEWRTPYFGKWFSERTDFWAEKTVKDSWVMRVVDVPYSVTKDQRTGVWKSVKVKKADIPLLDLDCKERWEFFPKGEVPEELLKKHPQLPKNLRGWPVWEGFKIHFPQYKGGRNLDWPFHLSYSDFKKYAEGITKNIAPLLGAKWVKADMCEFDDFARGYVVNHNEEKSPNTIVICTTDQDMDQLAGRNQFVRIWRPGGGENDPERWMDFTMEQATFHLFCKLVGGDTSDKIPGATFWEETGVKVKKRKETKYPTVKWETESKCKAGQKTVAFCERMISEFGNMRDAWPWLHEHQVDDTFSRNVSMMMLDAAPAYVLDRCKDVLKKAEVSVAKLTMADFGITEADRLSVANKAQAYYETGPVF